MAWRARAEGKIPVGRPRQTWGKGIKKILNERGIEWKGVRDIAGDCERWKDVAKTTNTCTELYHSFIQYTRTDSYMFRQWSAINRELIGFV
jgi:hypothetical protein